MSKYQLRKNVFFLLFWSQKYILFLLLLFIKIKVIFITTFINIWLSILIFFQNKFSIRKKNNKNKTHIQIQLMKIIKMIKCGNRSNLWIWIPKYLQSTIKKRKTSRNLILIEKYDYNKWLLNAIFNSATSY